MKRQLFLSLIAILFVFFVYYLLGSFISMEFNPLEWNLVSRLVVAGLGFFSFVKFFKDLSKLLNGQ